MAIKEPESMDELVYYTKRDLEGGKGTVTCWVYRQPCPKCKKGLMAKPRDPKTGKYKIRATEYVCEHCGYTVDKEEYVETLNGQAKYKCPHCSHEGTAEFPFKKKKVQLWDEEAQKKKSADAVQFQCEKCKGKINITKKMKE